MTTVADWIATTRRYVYGNNTGIVNRLPATLAAGATQFILEFTLSARTTPGSVLAVDDESMLVLDVDQPSRTVTVQRGYFNSLDVSHDAGTLVEINPRFSKPQIRQELQNELRSWGDGIFATDVFDTTVASGNPVVDLTGIQDFYFPLRVYRSPRSGRFNWVSVSFDGQRDLPISAFGAGSALVLNDTPTQAYQLRVVYARKFDLSVFDDTADVNDDLLLSDSLLDIPPYGAAWRLLSTREVKRTDTGAQGEPRLAQEVPAGEISTAAARLKLIRDQRLEDEATQLRSAWLWRS